MKEHTPHSEELKKVFKANPDPEEKFGSISDPDLVVLDDDEDPIGINIRREAQAEIEAMEQASKKFSKKFYQAESDEDMAQFSYCDGDISVKIEGTKEKVNHLLYKTDIARRLWDNGKYNYEN